MQQLAQREEIANMSQAEIDLRGRQLSERLALEQRHVRELAPVAQKQQKEAQDMGRVHVEQIGALRSKQAAADAEKTPVPVLAPASDVVNGAHEEPAPEQG